MARSTPLVTTSSSILPPSAATMPNTSPASGRGWRSIRTNILSSFPACSASGFSSSPSNTPEPYGKPRFPRVTIYDNVVAQHRLVAEEFGVSRVKLVTGFSMGAIQTYHWGALYPDEVERIAPYCGAARCSRHNYVFLEGLKAALTADAQWNEGWYKEKPAKGLRAFGTSLCRMGLFSGLLPRRARPQDARLFFA